jgi:hypothetical protein
MRTIRTTNPASGHFFDAPLCLLVSGPLASWRVKSSSTRTRLPIAPPLPVQCRAGFRFTTADDSPHLASHPRRGRSGRDARIRSSGCSSLVSFRVAGRGLRRPDRAPRKAPNLAHGRRGLKGTPWGKALLESGNLQEAPGLGGRTAIPRPISSRLTRPTVVSPKWKMEAASAAWQ